MEKIIDLLNNIDKLGEKIPKLDSVMDWSLKLTTLAVRVGPLCILFLGLIYLLIPPREANRKAGYRTVFGMGSVAAWRFTQLTSGVLMTIVGLILTISSKALVKELPQMEPSAMMDAAMSCIKVQVICALVIFVFMFILTALMFTYNGDFRFPILRGTLLEKVLFEERPFLMIIRYFCKKNQKQRRPKPMNLEETMTADEAPEAVEEPQPEYERQGEQVITADDIVIEGL